MEIQQCRRSTLDMLALYCTNKGDIAGVGYPTDQGWVWESNDAIAQEVADSISILKNEKVAEFILYHCGFIRSDDESDMDKKDLDCAEWIGHEHKCRSGYGAKVNQELS